jgi:hypothetical protein
MFRIARSLLGRISQTERSIAGSCTRNTRAGGIRVSDRGQPSHLGRCARVLHRRLPSTPNPTVLSSRRVPKSERSPSTPSLLCDSHEIPCSVVSHVPFAPDYNLLPRRIYKDFFGRIDVPRGYSDGFTAFFWRFDTTVQSVGTLKPPQGNKIMVGTLSAHVRGSTLLPNIPTNPFVTVSWYQALDPSGKCGVP